jgi:predicted ATPase
MLLRLAESLGGPQIILSTHSPYLIDCLDLDKHSVLVFRRDADGGCTARQVCKEKLRPFLNEFMLGEIWMNLGEEQIVEESAT